MTDYGDDDDDDDDDDSIVNVARGDEAEDQCQQ